MAEDRQNCRRSGMIANARMIPLVLQVLDDKAPLSSSSPCKENVSVKKLHNSSFEKIEREKGILTREKAKHIGAASSTFKEQLISSYRIPPCEQSLSKTHQRASERGSAEIVSSLLSRRSPSFWASHSGHTGLSSALRIFDKTRVKIEPSVRKPIWRPECDRDVAWV